MNDFTNNNVPRPPKANTVDYNTLINDLRDTLTTEPNINRVNDILLKLVNEVRMNPLKEDLVMRELKSELYNLQTRGNTEEEQTRLCVRTMQNFIKQLDPTFITEDTDGRPVIQAPMKTKSNEYTALDREIEAAIADGDDEELSYLLGLKQKSIEEMAKQAGINPEALTAPKNEESTNIDTSYSLDGLNLSEEAINALNNDLGVSVKNNKSELVENIAPVDWNEVKVETKVEEYVFPSEEETKKIIEEVKQEAPVKSQKEIEREELLRKLAELDREETPIKEEPKVEKAKEINWEEALKTAKEEVVDVEPELVEVEYKDPIDISNVETAVVTSEEIKKETIPEVDENASVKNIKHDTMPVEDFEKNFIAVSKVPSEKMLENFRGTRIEKIRAYAEAHKSGRKVYLPDSGYEVFISKMRDRQQLNYIYLLLEEAGYGSEVVQRYEIDELIRIVAEHVDFDFDVNPDKNEFLYNVSPRDFSLLVMMFAIINSPEVNSKNHAVAKVDRCGCTNCGNKVFFKNDTELDLYESFTKSYPFSKFLSGYNTYINNKPANIVLAYRKPGTYGELHKVTAEDDIFDYKLIFSKPTVGKIQNKDRNKDELVYRLLVESFNEKRDVLELPYTSTIDAIIAQCPDWNSYKEYTREFIRAYSEAGATEDLKTTYNAINYMGEQIDTLENNNNGLINLCTWIDAFKLTPKDSKFEAEEFNHEDFYELFQSILTAPNEIIRECVKVIDEMTDLEGLANSSVILDEAFVKGFIDFDRTYFTDEEALKRFDTNNPDASETRRNKFIEDRNAMRARMNNGECPVCGHKEFSIEYPQLLFFSIASRLYPKQAN